MLIKKLKQIYSEIRSRRKTKKHTFPLTIIQQSFLWLCLATSSKVKVFEFEAIDASATQSQPHPLPIQKNKGKFNAEKD